MSNVAEYLEIFPAEGLFSVEVKFKSGVKNKISKRRASFQDISNVIQLLSNQEDGHTCLRFDDYVLEVTDLHIDFAHKKVHLSVNDL